MIKIAPLVLEMSSDKEFIRTRDLGEISNESPDFKVFKTSLINNSNEE